MPYEQDAIYIKDAATLYCRNSIFLPYIRSLPAVLVMAAAYIITRTLLVKMAGAAYLHFIRAITARNIWHITAGHFWPPQQLITPYISRAAYYYYSRAKEVMQDIESRRPFSPAMPIAGDTTSHFISSHDASKYFVAATGKYPSQSSWVTDMPHQSKALPAFSCPTMTRHIIAFQEEVNAHDSGKSRRHHDGHIHAFMTRGS